MEKKEGENGIWIALWEYHKEADHLYHQRVSFFLIAESFLIVSIATLLSNCNNLKYMKIAVTLLGICFTSSWFYTNARLDKRITFLKSHSSPKLKDYQIYKGYINSVKGISSGFFTSYLLPIATLIFLLFYILTPEALLAIIFSLVALLIIELFALWLDKWLPNYNQKDC